MFGSQWDSLHGANALETRTATDLEAITFTSPDQCFRAIRLYLQRMKDTGRTSSGVHVLQRGKVEDDGVVITAGPSMFREPCGDCVQFSCGAQLSFGITLRLDLTVVRLSSYRFHLSLPKTSGLRFFRIDLNPPKTTYNSLHSPRSHMHPGFENVHVPFPVMQPLAVLDRIFHMIEPALTP